MSNRWSVEEETVLAQAWVAVHEDPYQHDAYSFWNRVVIIFNNLSDGPNRNKDMVSSKWGRLNSECIVFNGIYKHLRLTTGDDVSRMECELLKIAMVGIASSMFTCGRFWETTPDGPKCNVLFLVSYLLLMLYVLFLVSYCNVCFRKWIYLT